MSGALEHHVSPHGLTPGTGYSHVVSAAGRLVVVSGQVALDDQGEVVGADDARVQSEKVFENLGLALAAGGATFADVVKLTYFVLDVAILPTVREVRDRYVDTERPPASSAFQVGALFRSDLLLEVEALAVIDSR
jgi:enamine deaminase RidA (YjgF/YER057c/UK114 family)